jgi:predicted unusual protein kinase regulating ubiquinone biosynthesis (AarF/ABC1/UbiB family)
MWSCRLRQALVSLGPVFSAFGLYLSSRADLLPIADCLELAMIPESRPATPQERVREMIEHEFGCALDTLYSFFDLRPFELHLMHQSHRAVLRSGEAVTVKLVSPELDEQVNCDLEALSMMIHVLSSTKISLPLIENAVYDFSQNSLRSRNMLLELKNRLLTFQSIDGIGLDSILESIHSDKRQICKSRYQEIESNANELGQRLYDLWLRQVLLGRQFPVEINPEHIILLSNNQFSYTGGVFLNLSSETRKNLWNYLIAASTGVPDQACFYLLREVQSEEQAINEEKIRYRFREIVPFRDSHGSNNLGSDNLIDYLLIHWRLLSEHGLQLSPQLVGFYRGLVKTDAWVRQLSSHGDPLLDALQNVRVMVIMRQYQEMIAFGQASENIDKYLAAFMELPQQLNSALIFFNKTWSDQQTEDWTRNSDQVEKNTRAAFIALILFLFSFVLLSHYLMASMGENIWFNGLCVFIVMIIGALLLRIMMQS